MTGHTSNSSTALSRMGEGQGVSQQDRLRQRRKAGRYIWPDMIQRADHEHAELERRRRTR